MALRWWHRILLRSSKPSNINPVSQHTITVVKKNHLLLQLLPVSIIVNGKVIYPIPKNQPVEIVIPTNPAKIVVTDGFHITNPYEVKCNFRRNNYYHIGCGIENDQLIIGLIILLLVFMMGATSGMWILQLISLAPIVYFLYSFYIRRREFIQIKPA